MMMQLLGSGITSGPVTLTRDEQQAINKLYSFKPEGPNPKPSPPAAPAKEDFKTPWEYEQAQKKYQEALKAHANWKDPQPLMQAGADRNALRHAEADGMRLLAWFAKFVPVGEDPLKHFIQAVADAGWDVDPADLQWAETVDEEEEATP